MPSILFLSSRNPFDIQKLVKVFLCQKVNLPFFSLPASLSVNIYVYAWLNF